MSQITAVPAVANGAVAINRNGRVETRAAGGRRPNGAIAVNSGKTPGMMFAGRADEVHRGVHAAALERSRERRARAERVPVTAEPLETERDSSGFRIEIGSSTRDRTPSTALIQYTRAWIGLISGERTSVTPPESSTPAAAIRPAPGIPPITFRLTRSPSLIVSGIADRRTNAHAGLVEEEHVERQSPRRRSPPAEHCCRPGRNLEDRQAADVFEAPLVNAPVCCRPPADARGADVRDDRAGRDQAERVRHLGLGRSRHRQKTYRINPTISFLITPLPPFR